MILPPKAFLSFLEDFPISWEPPGHLWGFLGAFLGPSWGLLELPRSFLGFPGNFVGAANLVKYGGSLPLGLLGERWTL